MWDSEVGRSVEEAAESFKLENDENKNNLDNLNINKFNDDDCPETIPAVKVLKKSKPALKLDVCELDGWAFRFVESITNEVSKPMNRISYSD